MATLKFKNDDLKKIITEQKDKTKFMCSLSQQMRLYTEDTGLDFDFRNEMPEKYRTTETPSLWLVKDSGIYVMSSHSMVGTNPPTDKKHIAYAAGYDPAKGDVYDKCRQAVGGDDFVEDFELSPGMHSAIADGYDMTINITPTKFTVRFSKMVPAKKKSLPVASQG